MRRCVILLVLPFLVVLGLLFQSSMLKISHSSVGNAPSVKDNLQSRFSSIVRKAELAWDQIPALSLLQSRHGAALQGKSWPTALALDVNLGNCSQKAKVKSQPDEKQLLLDWEVLSVEDTFTFLINGGSITRFGDGEWDAQRESQGLTKETAVINKGMESKGKKLTQKLRKIPSLGSADGRLQIVVQGLTDTALPYCIGMVPLQNRSLIDLMDEKGKKFHDKYRNGFRIGGEEKKTQYDWYRWFPKGKYCSTSVTRPDHRTDLPEQYFWNEWRKVFKGRAILFVGPIVDVHGAPVQLARFGVLQCAALVVHLPAPRSKAFKMHDKILANIVLEWNGFGNQSTFAFANEPALRPIVALVMGPAATVLAGELPCLGIPAIDLGHMNPYEDQPQEHRSDCSATGPEIVEPKTS